MILGYSRVFSSGASLPTTNLTWHVDFSDISTLYKTFTSGANPCYSNVATADADSISAVSSLTPAPTSDWALQNSADSTRNPLLRKTSPLLGTQCLDFDGTNDVLGLFNRTGDVAKPASALFSASAKTALISFRCESLPAVASTFQPLLADQSGSFFWGIYVYNNAGTVQIMFQNYDGTYDSLFVGTVAANTNYTVMVRHETGNLYASLNGGAESSLASGNTSNLTGGVYVAGGSSGAVFNGRIGEIATYNAALTGTDLSNAISYFTSKWP